MTILKINLFIFVFGCAGSSLVARAFSSFGKQGLLLLMVHWTSHCSGFSCCRAQALELAGFSSCVHQLRCPVTCGILLDHRLNPYPQHWQADPQTLDHQESLLKWPLLTVLLSSPLNLQIIFPLNLIAHIMMFMCFIS